jgi:archaellum component FlaG (FlaF/FlaG flagellin family)
MKAKAIILGAAALLLAGTAVAQQAAYTWTGYGTNMGGSNKCPTYKMTIQVTVQGNSVKGAFQQEGRDQRSFTATLGPGGVFKTKAAISNGNTMEVTGTIADGGPSKVLLEGYCKFDAALIRKPAS